MGIPNRHLADALLVQKQSASEVKKRLARGGQKASKLAKEAKELLARNNAKPAMRVLRQAIFSAVNGEKRVVVKEGVTPGIEAFLELRGFRITTVEAERRRFRRLKQVVEANEKREADSRLESHKFHLASAKAEIALIADAVRSWLHRDHASKYSMAHIDNHILPLIFGPLTVTDPNCKWKNVLRILDEWIGMNKIGKSEDEFEELQEFDDDVYLHYLATGAVEQERLRRVVGSLKLNILKVSQISKHAKLAKKHVQAAVSLLTEPLSVDSAWILGQRSGLKLGHWFMDDFPTRL